MGQRDGFSANDLEKISKSYKCKNTNTNTSTILDSHYPGINTVDESIDETPIVVKPTTTRKPKRPVLAAINSIMHAIG